MDFTTSAIKKHMQGHQDKAQKIHDEIDDAQRKLDNEKRQQAPHNGQVKG